MNTDDLLYRENVARHRDPRFAKVGYHAVDTYGGTPCHFKWFDSVEALVSDLLDVELDLRCYPKGEHDERRRAMEEVLQEARVRGLTESIRDALNGIDWGCEVAWWGDIANLSSGGTEFARQVRKEFELSRGMGPSGGSIDLPSFIEFVRGYCGSLPVAREQANLSSDLAAQRRSTVD